MKISRLTAQEVHGYLPIDVTFFPELTFLIGLNGSGKTSALRILMSLLTPNVEELGLISFKQASVSIQDGDKEIIICAERSIDGVKVIVSHVEESLQITNYDFEIIADLRHRDENRSPVIERIHKHPVYIMIKSLSTPMFLGLDRRFYTPRIGDEEQNDVRRREYMMRRYAVDEGHIRDSAAASLAEVAYLFSTRLQEVRAAQEKLDDKLREDFFKNAFKYNPGANLNLSPELISLKEIESYRTQLKTIEKTSGGLRIPIPEIQVALTSFFERMSEIAESLERGQKARSKKSKFVKSDTTVKTTPEILENDYVEWIINWPQAKRIFENLHLLNKYIQERNALHDPITRFISLINGFLSQTHKEVVVTPKGLLGVSIAREDDIKPISALSSGERQLVVMLAHLAFNPNLSTSGIFIVDEPELSLHMDWQEKFVDAVIQANPKVQIILATHSPAIILDRTTSCCTLNEVRNA